MTPPVSTVVVVSFLPGFPERNASRSRDATVYDAVASRPGYVPGRFGPQLKLLTPVTDPPAP